jgi:hypothetical protein
MILKYLSVQTREEAHQAVQVRREVQARGARHLPPHAPWRGVDARLGDLLGLRWYLLL